MHLRGTAAVVPRLAATERWSASLSGPLACGWTAAVQDGQRAVPSSGRLVAVLTRQHLMAQGEPRMAAEGAAMDDLRLTPLRA